MSFALLSHHRPEKRKKVKNRVNKVKKFAEIA
jgi:hypothetical protein